MMEEGNELFSVNNHQDRRAQANYISANRECVDRKYKIKLWNW